LIHVKETVIVEGKYDKIKLASIIDAVIIETNGFSIFNDREKLELIRKLAVKNGVLIITDSDAAGFKIRHFLGGALPTDQVKHAYIPDIFGKEKRKSIPSKEGKLGVEGVPAEAVMQSLARAGVLCEETIEPRRLVTKTDFFEDGLSGGAGSVERRKKLLAQLDLPQRLSSNGLLQVLQAMFTYEEYKAAIKRLDKEIDK
jgi:ribonuclease M5